MPRIFKHSVGVVQSDDSSLRTHPRKILQRSIMKKKQLVSLSYFSMPGAKILLAKKSRVEE